MDAMHTITAEQAAEIASRHGLRLDDAVALRLLADDVETAERIASMFSASKDGDRDTSS